MWNDKGEKGEERYRREIRRKLALHGGLEYRPTPTGWLHHRRRLHLLRPTFYLPIHAAYPAPSGWRHAQDASGVKLPRASLPLSLCFPLFHSLFPFLPLHPSYDPRLSALSVGLYPIPEKCVTFEICATTDRTLRSKSVCLIFHVNFCVRYKRDLWKILIFSLYFWKYLENN